MKKYNNFDFLKSFSEFVEINGSDIKFQIQDGPIDLYGQNGCQVDDLIIVAKKIIEKFNKQFESKYNTLAIESLNECLDMLSFRRRERIRRKVEGKLVL